MSLKMLNAWKLIARCMKICSLWVSTIRCQRVQATWYWPDLSFKEMYFIHFRRFSSCSLFKENKPFLLVNVSVQSILHHSFLYFAFLSYFDSLHT